MLEPWTAPKGLVIPGHSAEPLEAKLTFLTYLPKKLKSQPFLPRHHPQHLPASSFPCSDWAFFPITSLFDMDFHLCMKCTACHLFPPRHHQLHESGIPVCSSRAEVPNLSRTDASGWLALCSGGAVLYIAGCSAASLAYIYWMPVASLSWNNQNVSRHQQMSPRGQKSPWLRTTDPEQMFLGRQMSKAGFLRAVRKTLVFF